MSIRPAPLHRLYRQPILIQTSRPSRRHDDEAPEASRHCSQLIGLTRSHSMVEEVRVSRRAVAVPWDEMGTTSRASVPRRTQPELENLIAAALLILVNIVAIAALHEEEALEHPTVSQTLSYLPCARIRYLRFKLDTWMGSIQHQWETSYTREWQQEEESRRCSGKRSWPSRYQVE